MLYRTPGHKDIELNQKANAAAGEAAATEGEKFLLPFSLACTRQHAKHISNNRGADIERDGYKITGKEIVKAFDNLKKGQAAAIFQLWSRHCTLNHFLARIQAVTSNRYQPCGQKRDYNFPLAILPEVC